MTSRHHVTTFTIEFGDCDPAQIVFYPNYFRFMDSAARHFFVAIGVPAWSAVDDAPDLIGVPLVDASARFRSPATYGDVIDVDSSVTEWRRTSFVMSHIIRREGRVLVEGQEVRVFACRDGDDPKRIRAIEPPQSIVRLIER